MRVQLLLSGRDPNHPCLGLYWPFQPCLARAPPTLHPAPLPLFSHLGALKFPTLGGYLGYLSWLIFLFLDLSSTPRQINPGVLWALTASELAKCGYSVVQTNRLENETQRNCLVPSPPRAVPFRPGFEGKRPLLKTSTGRRISECHVALTGSGIHSCH